MGTYSPGSVTACTQCAGNLNSPVGSGSCNTSYPVFALVAEWTSGMLRKMDMLSYSVSTLAGSFNNPAGMSLSPYGDFALVTSNPSNVIYRIDLVFLTYTVLAGQSLPGSQDGIGSSASFSTPVGIAISPDATFALVVDVNNHAIRKINLSDRSVTRIAGTLAAAYVEGSGTSIAFNGPNYVAISKDGSFALISEYSGNRIRKITLTGGVPVSSLVAGSILSTAGAVNGVGSAASFFNPQEMAISSDMTIAIVIDRSNNILRKVVISTRTVSSLVAIAGASPIGVAWGALEDFLIVSGGSTNKIYSVAYPSGTLTTIAGSGLSGSVDNATGASAQFSNPTSVALWRCLLIGYGVYSSSKVCSICLHNGPLTVLTIDEHQ